MILPQRPLKARPPTSSADLTTPNALRSSVSGNMFPHMSDSSTSPSTYSAGMPQLSIHYRQRCNVTPTSSPRRNSTTTNAPYAHLKLKSPRHTAASVEAISPEPDPIQTNRCHIRLLCRRGPHTALHFSMVQPSRLRPKKIRRHLNHGKLPKT